MRKINDGNPDGTYQITEIRSKYQTDTELYAKLYKVQQQVAEYNASHGTNIKVDVQVKGADYTPQMLHTALEGGE